MNSLHTLNLTTKSGGATLFGTEYSMTSTHTVDFSIQDGLRLLVATEDGVLYIYNFDPTEGGDLQLYKKYLLDDCGADQADASRGTDSDKPAAGKNFP